MYSEASTQDFATWEKLSFNNPEDYSRHESAIKDITGYLLNSPEKPQDPKRQLAYSVLIRWMSGTPNHTFAVDHSLVALMKGNEVIVGLFMAAQASYVLTNGKIDNDSKDIKLNAFKILLDYVTDESNGIKHTRELKKAIEASKEGRLAEYLE